MPQKGDDKLTLEQITYIKKCIADNDMHRFYIWTPWLNVRETVLHMDRHECQDCKRNGVYRRATTVHHVNHVKRHPEMALDIWYTWKEERRRNLVSLCHDCHERRHGYRKPEHKEPLTQERWD